LFSKIALPYQSYGFGLGGHVLKKAAHEGADSHSSLPGALFRRIILTGNSFAELVPLNPHNAQLSSPKVEAQIPSFAHEFQTPKVSRS